MSDGQLEGGEVVVVVVEGVMEGSRNFPCWPPSVAT